jgi:D-aspartate ligase
MRFSLDVDVRRLRAARPPVFLLGGLDLLRPLGHAGIPAIIASPETDEPAFASRFATGRCLLPPLAGGDHAAACLLDAGARLSGLLGRRIPLFYGNDDYLNLIYAHRAKLAKHFLLLLNRPEIAHSLLDKDAFVALCKARGLPVPRGLSWESTGPDALALERGPVLVKPRHKVGWEESEMFARLFGSNSKARVFASGREAMRNLPAAHHRADLLFQEYIGGDDRQLWSFHGFADEGGTVLAWFVGRKLRTYPAHTGLSTFLELAHNDELAALGHRVVARIPLKGVFKIDFKQDAASGRYTMLEVNARYNLWHHLGARNGVNLLQTAYDYLVDGRSPGAAPYRTERRWICLRLDLRACRELVGRGELTVTRWLGSLLRSRLVHDLFSWNDPKPWLQWWVLRVRSRLQRLAGRFSTRMRQWPFTAS